MPTTLLPEGDATCDLSRTVRARRGNLVEVVRLAPASTEPTLALLAGADEVVSGPLMLDALRARCERVRRRARQFVRTRS